MTLNHISRLCGCDRSRFDWHLPACQLFLTTVATMGAGDERSSCRPTSLSCVTPIQTSKQRPRLWQFFCLASNTTGESQNASLSIFFPHRADKTAACPLSSGPGSFSWRDSAAASVTGGLELVSRCARCMLHRAPLPVLSVPFQFLSYLPDLVLDLCRER